MAFDGADTSDSPSPLSSSPWFPPLLIAPASSWEDIFPHCDQNESGSFLSWLCPLSLQSYPTALWHCWGRGWKGKGLAIPRDPPPPRSQRWETSVVFHITDKLWQMGSGQRFLHTHVIPAITLVLLSSPHSAPCVSWEDSYQCEEVTDGNANLIWGACSLLFIFCLQWQGICSNERNN